MPPTKRTAPPRKPRTTRPEPEEEVYEEDAAEAQELEATGHYVSATLSSDYGETGRSEELRIIPPGAWRMSWQRLLQQGNLDEFARLVMPPEDYELFQEIDPTNDEFGEFIAEAARRAGESLGKSPGPAGSSRRTRKP